MTVKTTWRIRVLQPCLIFKDEGRIIDADVSFVRSSTLAGSGFARNFLITKKYIVTNTTAYFPLRKQI